eukprot:1227612-Rhodomonas_salina.3
MGYSCTDSARRYHGDWIQLYCLVLTVNTVVRTVDTVVLTVLRAGGRGAGDDGSHAHRPAGSLGPDCRARAGARRVGRAVCCGRFSTTGYARPGTDTGYCATAMSGRYAGSGTEVGSGGRV